MHHQRHDHRADSTTAWPLYDPAYEHDSCGVGLVVDIHGQRLLHDLA